MIIREKDKIELLKILEQSGIAMEVWAFGSRVKGTAHDASDLDIVLRSENLEPIPFVTLNKLTHAIDDSNIPIIIKPLDWGRIPDYFKTNITEQYEVIFSSLIKETSNSN